MKVRSIFHAHNWPFAKVRERLASLRQGGFDAIQISPAQKSPPGSEWYLRYQPFDHLEIEGLGTSEELANLCREAKALGLTIIADVVFNHMAILPGMSRKHWLAAEKSRSQGDSTAFAALVAKLASFPHLTPADFQPWRDMQGDDWDSEHRYESWGNGEWAELKPTERVLALHKQHLQILFDCGVRGFRFDAVKHMRVPHLQHYVDQIASFPEPCWSYGEVLSGDPVMQREYAGLFPTTDFPFLLHLKDALEQRPLPAVLDPSKVFLSPESIRFGLNHDLVLNPPELVSGLLFADAVHTTLVGCLAVLMVGGVTLVFADEYERDPLLAACVAFRAEQGGLDGPCLVSCQDAVWAIEARSTKLLLDVGRATLSHN